MKKRIILFSLFIILVILSSTIIFKVHNKQNSKEDNQSQTEFESKNNTENTYNLLPNHVKATYDLIDPFINTHEMSTCYNGMYQNKKISVENLSAESKIYYLVKRIYKEGYFNNRIYYEIIDDDLNNLKEITKVEADTIKESGVWYTDYILEKYPDVTKKVFQEFALNLLGEKKLIFSSVDLVDDNVYIVCDYDKEYSCHSVSDGGTGPRPNMLDYLKNMKKKMEC